MKNEQTGEKIEHVLRIAKNFLATDLHILW